ncbi:MAG TPA: hypothetical protein VF735_19735 [Pyrinomonadaceae bacterium]|jgi:hypothetical protein
MKRMLLYVIAVLLTFLGGVSADVAFNYDYYRARARYMEYRRVHHRTVGDVVVVGAAAAEGKRARLE